MSLASPDVHLGKGKTINERHNCTSMSDYQQLSPDKKPLTAKGNDERFFDAEEYDRLRRQYNK